MKKLDKLFILLAAILILGGCSSGKKAFEKGDYYSAVLKSVDRLRKNPNHKKSRETLLYAYPAAVEFLSSEVNNLKASGQRFKWGRIVNAYEKVNNMGDQIRRSPGALRIIPNPERFGGALTTARNSAADEHYKEGLRLINPNNREASKEAYYQFQKANGFMSGYKNSVQKAQEAREYATLKVILEQIPVPGRYSLSADFFQDKVEEFLRGGGIYQNEFLQFFTPRQAQRQNLQDADHILSIYFEDFTVGNVFQKQTIREVSRDSVKVGETVIDDVKHPVFGTVKAEFTVNRAEIVSEGLVTMRVIDARTEGVLLREKLPGTYVWYTEWASYQGDDRALTDEEYALTKLRQVGPPPNQDLFIEFTRPIYSQLTQRLNNFYRRF